MNNQMQTLQKALTLCKDPQMVNLIRNEINSPEQLISHLCNAYPQHANTINTMLKAGQNPMNAVISMLNNYFKG